MPCAFIEPAHLLDLDAASTSVTAWKRILATRQAGTLPPVAHCESDPTGTAITSAGYATEALLGTEQTGRDLAAHLDAILRPYQLRGVAWIVDTIERTGGALLADEMGLGKTVQAIGALTQRGEHGPQLVVCPKSLMHNWFREIKRFAPQLRPHLHAGEMEAAGAGDVVITSYPRLRLHADDLQRPWTTAVFDEAHVMKNSRTQVARAARNLTATGKLALTGTPVENSLDELWSILHIVVPQHFPHRAVFRRRFTRAVADGDEAALARLRVAVAPVMMARAKRQVAGSLPPKIDNPVLCDLTDEQAELYDRTLDDAIATGFGHGVERHGRVLAVLTALKQVCNHPGLVNGDLRAPTGRSGKVEVLLDLLATNLATDAPTLVFTQYRATGELLMRLIREEHGVDAGFFHGGLDDAERDRLITDFQAGTGPPILILSVKAGGVGLTLTRACDVVHFDRWWNPAVESQATDRAHRIGQDRPVTVTTLTTATTIEEHIAKLHERKAALGTHATDTSAVTELARLDDERLLETLQRSREGA